MGLAVRAKEMSSNGTTFDDPAEVVVPGAAEENRGVVGRTNLIQLLNEAQALVRQRRGGWPTARVEGGGRAGSHGLSGS